MTSENKDSSSKNRSLYDLTKNRSQISDLGKGPAHEVVEDVQKKENHVMKETWTSSLDFFFATLGYAGLLQINLKCF